MFIDLADKLGSDTRIVLVRTSEVQDRELEAKNIVSIHRTSNQHELTEIYTAVDIFVNRHGKKIIQQ